MTILVSRVVPREQRLVVHAPLGEVEMLYELPGQDVQPGNAGSC